MLSKANRTHRESEQRGDLFEWTWVEESFWDIEAQHRSSHGFSRAIPSEVKSELNKKEDEKKTDTN